MSDNKILVTESDGFADPSFGPNGFGFIKDGYKTRFSQTALNAFMVFVSLFATTMTFLSSPNQEFIFEKPSDSLIAPSDFQNGEELSPPPMYDEIRTQKSLDNSHKVNRRVEKIEGLSIVSLTQLRAIPAGTEGKAILVSGASNGPIKARFTESIRIEGDVLIESGSILYGLGQSTEERLFITFSKLISPSGREIKIKAQAYDESDNIVGLKGSKVSSHAAKFALGTGLSFLSGYVEAMKEPQPVFGMTGGSRSPKDAAFDGAATAAADQGKSIMESIKNAPVIIEVKRNSPIWVVFEEGNLK